MKARLKERWWKRKDRKRKKRKRRIEKKVRNTVKMKTNKIGA